MFKRNISFAELREWVLYKKRKQLSKFNKFMLWLNYFAIVCFILSYSARFISPQTFWLLAFFGIAYPVVLIVNIFFVLYWMLQWRSLALLSLFFIAIGYNTILSYVQFNFNSNQSANNADVKIMTYNSMLFDLYNWSKNSQSRSTIFNMLRDENPDIICLQEFYTSEDPQSFNNTDTVQKLLKMEYGHVEYTQTLRKIDHWGLATFSKYPILRKGKIVFNTNWNNMCLFTDVLINKDTVRIYNVHFASIHFGKKEYKFINDVLEKKETEEVEGSKSILRLLKHGFLNRATQVSMVADHISKCKYKIIVCGDFNDTPSSFAYRKIKGDLRDAFRQSGSGIGQTYTGKIPFQRIDYILHDRDFTSYNYKINKESITDHYPVSCYLRLMEE